MQVPKQRSPAASRICELIEEGKSRGFWKTVREVAEHIGMPRKTLSSQINDEVKDEKVLVKTERKIREVLENLSLPQEVEEDPTFQLVETVVRKTVREVLLALPVSDVLPLILTAGNIRKLTGTASDDQIQRIIGVLHSITRTINHVTQIDTVEERARIWKQIRPAVEELYLALELGKEAIPSAAAERIASLRTKFQDLK